MSENYTKRLNHELLVYASGIDLAVQMTKANGNDEYVILPQKELTELTQYIREKVIDEPAIAENAKSILRARARELRGELGADPYMKVKTSTIMILCDLIDEVCE